MSVVFNLGGGNWAGRYSKMLAYKVDNENYIANELNFTRTTTGTFVNQNGLIEEQEIRVPRVDYLNNSNGTLLVEPQSTNLITYSQSLSNTNRNGTFVDNFAISPDGTQNATKITATNTDPFFYQNVTLNAATYTASLWVKGIGNSIGKEFRFAISNQTHIGNKYIIPSEWTRFDKKMGLYLSLSLIHI